MQLSLGGLAAVPELSAPLPEVRAVRAVRAVRDGFLRADWVWSWEGAAPRCEPRPAPRCIVLTLVSRFKIGWLQPTLLTS